MSEPSHSFRILVVDDEDFSRQMMVRQLTQLGSESVTAVSSEAQARQAMTNDPALSLLICDHYMPDSSGLRLLWDIRAGCLPIPHDVLFVLATSSKSFALAAVALTLDADSFMSKPFSQNDLARRLYASLVSGTRSIKPASHYAAIDVPAMLAAAERVDPAAPPPLIPKSMPLRNLVPGNPLPKDLPGPGGVILLPAGTIVTRHLLARLRELGVDEIPC